MCSLRNNTLTEGIFMHLNIKLMSNTADLGCSLFSPQSPFTVLLAFIMLFSVVECWMLNNYFTVHKDFDAIFVHYL